jgi:hypothetical protein
MLVQATQADDDYLAKNQSRLGDLITRRNVAQQEVDRIEQELAKLRLELPPVVSGIDEIIGRASKDALTLWIQAKALTEVLAAELSDAIRRLETDLSVLQDDASTPDRPCGKSLTTVDESFAHMLAQAKAIVDRLIGEGDAADP